MDSKIHLALVQNKVTNCTRCELSNRVTPVHIHGELPAKFVVVGEAPGKVENYKREPFVGPAGRLLKNKLRMAGLDSYMMMNIVSCWPDGQPKKEHIKACRVNVQEQLMAACTDKVLIVGGTALQGLAPNAALKWTQGSILQIHGFDMMVTWHPAFILKSRSKKIDEDLTRALKIWRLVVDGHMPAEWMRNNHCIYCGGGRLVGDSPACYKHQTLWRQDQQWQKPTQTSLGL